MNPAGSLPTLLAAVFVSALLCAAGAPPAAAQSPQPGSAAPSTSDAIPFAEIPARASSVRLTLDAMRSRLSAPGGGADAGLEPMGGVIDRLRLQADPSRLDRLPDFRINELERQVEFYRRELASDQSRNVARATRLSADAAELTRLRGQWSATLAAAEREGVSRPLVEELRSVIGQIDATEALLERPLDRSLAGRERAGRYETSLETLSQGLEEASNRAWARRLTRDAPPLWSADALQVPPGRDWAGVRSRFDGQLRFGSDFFAARREAIEAFGLASLLALVAVAWMRRKSHWLGPAGEQLPDASRVLKRPFSSLLLVLLASALLLTDLAPPIVVETLAVAIMVVLLRLMPGRLVAGRRLLLVGLAALFVVDRARAMMPFDSLAFRIDQLVVAGGLAAGYAYVLWLKRRGEVPDKSWLALLAHVALPALALLAAGLVSNVAGNVSLGDLLVRGTLASTYASAILYAARFIVDDFLWMMVRSRAGQRLRMVTLRGEEMARGSQRLTRVLALLCWVYVTLLVFEVWEPVSEWMVRLLGVSWHLGQLSFTLGGLATFVIGVLVALYASRTVRFLLNEEVLSRLPWPAGAKSTTATLAYYGVLFAGLLLALSAAGIEISRFALVIGALGVGIGFGLQNVVNNFVSGIILMFERPIQPGDVIDVGTMQGKVIEIGLRATRVRTWEGAEVIVPNGTMLAGNLVNWTLSDTTRRVEIPVGVAYGSSVGKVMELLLEAARAQPDALKEPEPVVVFNGFGESSLDFIVRFWAPDAAVAASARSETGVRICESLEAAGIEIPFPQRDLHLRSVSPEAKTALKE